ncbi:hypothetical protein HS048_29120 [Planomonospora sp. ID91781]|uniref:hypothetical protein n=1 Tax=Planomonospora sp. ID91781 TaxID=2738135 RepID=UPI0018C36CC5|nr:hypothetical protein [Planomonospora sp. ID91781]MBG0824769.1 hypothetical protein [Planomonospora sp. ID91781]
MQLACLDVVDDEDVFAVTGTQVESFAVGGAVVAVGSSSTAIIVDAGDDPAASGVRTGSRLTLVGPLPQAAASRMLEHDPASRPIHLFVRVADGLLYLGRGEHAHSRWNRDGLDCCDLRIDPPLERDVLDRVRPASLPVGLPGLQWLEHVNGDRTEALRLFITGWHPVTVPGPDPVAPPVPVPVVLAEFYRLAQGRPGVLGGQNAIRPPAEPRIEAAGRLEVGYENQGGFSWSRWIPRRTTRSCGEQTTPLRAGTPNGSG